MAINLSFLGAVSGIAQGYSDRVDSLRDELKDGKRRQREWLATYGNKALDESNKQQDTITSALDDLKARGLKVPDAIQLLQKHGAGAVLQLQKYIKNYEETNNTKVDEVLMNKLWTAAEDFTTEDRTFEDAVNTLFGSPKDGATAPVIQEVEDRNFFERIKYNMGDRYEDEYEDFLSDPTEGIGGKSIKELRAMSVSSPSMLGTEGSAVFDRSVLRGSEPSPGEARLWKDTVPIIVREALKNLSPEDRAAVEMTEDANFNRIARDTDAIFFDLSDPEGVYFDAFSEATRKVHEQNPFSNNRSATGAYGGQAALDAILNSESAATIAQREKEEKLKEDLETANYTEENKPSEVASATEAQEYFNNNPDANHVILNDELISRDSADTPPPKDKPPPKDEPEYDSSFQLTVQPNKASIEARPSEFIGEIVTEEDFEKASTTEDDQAAWDTKYDGKYRKDGTAILVAIKSTLTSEQQRQWDIFYEETHDPETGKPLTSGSQ